MGSVRPNRLKAKGATPGKGGRDRDGEEGFGSPAALGVRTKRPKERFLDGFVHSIGFAPREAIAGDFLDGLSRESFRIAHDISAYSFPAMAKAAAPRLRTAPRC